MSNHRFHIDLPAAWQADEVPAPLLQMLADKAKESGTEADLGPRTGAATVGTPVGPVEVCYELETPRLWFEIRNKPMLVPNNMLETAIRNGCDKYFAKYPDGLGTDPSSVA